MIRKIAIMSGCAVGIVMVLCVCTGTHMNACCVSQWLHNAHELDALLLHNAHELDALLLHNAHELDALLPCWNCDVPVRGHWYTYGSVVSHAPYTHK